MDPKGGDATALGDGVFACGVHWWAGVFENHMGGQPQISRKTKGQHPIVHCELARRTKHIECVVPGASLEQSPNAKRPRQ